MEAPASPDGVRGDPRGVEELLSVPRTRLGPMTRIARARSAPRSVRRTRGFRTTIRAPIPFVVGVALLMGVPPAALGAAPPAGPPNPAVAPGPVPALASGPVPALASGPSGRFPATIHPSATGWLRPGATAHGIAGGPGTVSGPARQGPGPLPGGAARPSSHAPSPGVLPTGGSSSAQLVGGPGFSGIDSSQCGCAPPDVQDAIGRYEVAEIVNAYLEVWDRSGTVVGGQDLATFYHTTNFLSDPRIAYDNLSGRFFTSILEASSSSAGVYFAVSDGPNASGSWTTYKLLSSGSGSLPDQPWMGLNETLLAFNANVFGSSGYLGSETWFVNKSDVLRGSTAAFSTFGPDAQGFSMHPSTALQAGSPLWLVETLPGSPAAVDLLEVSGVPPGPTTLASTNLSIADVPGAPATATPGGGTLDTGSSRAGDVLLSHGRLYSAFVEGCTEGLATRACVRVLVVNTTPSLGVSEDLTLRWTDAYLYYPAITLDARDDLTLIAGLANSSTDPGLVGTTHRAGDAWTSFAPWTVLLNGTSRLPSACNGCRYGDYFGAATDPLGPVAWLSGELVDGSGGWLTWVGPALPLGPTSARLLAPLVGEEGVPVNLTLAVSNTPCLAALGLYCSATVTLGDGSNVSLACGSVVDRTTLSETFVTRGNFTLGAPGAVALFDRSGCPSSARAASYPVLGSQLQIVTRISVGILDSNGGAGDVGENVTFRAAAVTGAPPVSYRWTGLPAGCPAIDAPRIDCAPTAPGRTTVAVVATDASNVSAAATDAYRVYPAPQVTLVAPVWHSEVGLSAGMTGGVTGGLAPFTYDWNGLPPGCLPINATAQACRFTSDGTFQATLSVIDANGVNATSPILVLLVEPAVSVALNLTPSAPSAGATVAISAVPTGGLEPFAYRWTGLPSGCPGAGPSLDCALPAGSITISVTVTDSLGASASANRTLVVPAAGGPTASGLPLIVLELGGLAAVALAAVVVAAVALRRRRRR